MNDNDRQTQVTICELFGLNPRAVRSLDIRVRLNEPVIVEAELYVIGDPIIGKPLPMMSGQELLTTTKRFTVTEIEDTP